MVHTADQYRIAFSTDVSELQSYMRRHGGEGAWDLIAPMYSCIWYAVKRPS